MRSQVRTCGCEDWPCCGHGESFSSHPPEEPEITECTGYQSLEIEDCEDMDCDHLKGCWGDEHQ